MGIVEKVKNLGRNERLIPRIDCLTCLKPLTNTPPRLQETQLFSKELFQNQSKVFLPLKAAFAIGKRQGFRNLFDFFLSFLDFLLQTRNSTRGFVGLSVGLW